MEFPVVIKYRDWSGRWKYARHSSGEMKEFATQGKVNRYLKRHTYELDDAKVVSKSEVVKKKGH